MSAAERQRRHRQRVKVGVRVIPVPVAPAVVQALIARGLLAEKDEHDASAVSAALVRSTEGIPGKVRNALR